MQDDFPCTRVQLFQKGYQEDVEGFGQERGGGFVRQAQEEV